MVASQEVSSTFPPALQIDKFTKDKSGPSLPWPFFPRASCSIWGQLWEHCANSVFFSCPPTPWSPLPHSIRLHGHSVLPCPTSQLSTVACQREWPFNGCLRLNLNPLNLVRWIDSWSFDKTWKPGWIDSARVNRFNGRARNLEWIFIMTPSRARKSFSKASP